MCINILLNATYLQDLGQRQFHPTQSLFHIRISERTTKIIQRLARRDNQNHFFKDCTRNVRTSAT